MGRRLHRSVRGMRARALFLRRATPVARARAPALVVVAVLAMVLGLAGSACQATTAVSVVDHADGSGLVTVTVTVDGAANSAIGGLAEQLDTSGLAAQGWVVTPVAPLAGGGARVSARHAFANPTQLSSVVGSIAGTGGAHLFSLSVVRRHGLWQDHTTLTGRVDLACGAACFGDAALGRLTGSTLGFDVARASAKAGVTPAQVLHFSVSASLPGTLQHTDADGRSAATLLWQPVLGHQLPLDAATSSYNRRSIEAAVGGAAVAVVLLSAVIALAWRRRRRRRRRGRGRRFGSPVGASWR